MASSSPAPPGPSCSPLSTPPDSQPNIHGIRRAPLQRQYRPARDIPFELAQHVQIYFEEGLLAQALSFLTTLVSSGTASIDLTAPTLIPSIAHLAITSTLAVHPSFTTRTIAKEKWQISNSALRLLRLTNKVNGPVNSDFYRAFVFKKYDSRSSRNGGRKVDSKDEDEVEVINIAYADSESIWSRAEDFWQVVGWTLNCSCLEGMYAARWQYWQIWMEAMLQILEDDWEIRFHEGKSEESLIWQYIDLASGGHGKHRRILRAIFADGSTKSMNEFKEIFRNELKEPKKDDDKLKKREVDVNVEAEVYGDYMARDDDEVSEEETINASNASSRRSKRSRTPSSRHITPRTSASSLRSSYSVMDTDTDSPPSISSSTLGPPASLAIRLRLLHLLSHLAGSIPDYFLEIRELYTLFVEFVRPLPLLIFQQLISPTIYPHETTLSPDAHTTLCEFVLHRMLESAAPAVHEEAFLTQKKLVEDYLPWAASRGDAESNAKVSLLIEVLTRRLNGAGKLRRTKELEEAVSTGIQRRCARAGEAGEGKKKRKGDRRGEEVAWSWLVESGERMAAVVRGLS